MHEFIKRDGEIELIPRGCEEKVYARSVRISPVFSLRHINCRYLCTEVFPYIPLCLSLPLNKKHTVSFLLLHPVRYNVRDYHLLTQISTTRSDPAYVPIYFSAFPAVAFLDRSGEPNDEGRMGNDRLKPCRDRTNVDGLALRSTDIICPPNSRQTMHVGIA